jgi:hypothetical protein
LLSFHRLGHGFLPRAFAKCEQRHTRMVEPSFGNPAQHRAVRRTVTTAVPEEKYKASGSRDALIWIKDKTATVQWSQSSSASRFTAGAFGFRVEHQALRTNSGSLAMFAARFVLDSNESSDLPIVFQMTHCVLCARIVRAQDNRSGQ